MYFYLNNSISYFHVMKNPSFKESVWQLKQKTDTITDNHILNLFDINLCERIDERASSDSAIQKKREICLNNLSNCDVEYSVHYKRAFDSYNEIAVFDFLKSKYNIRFQNEGTDSTPDYVYTSVKSHEINIDLKTLSYNHDMINFKEIQDQGLASKISIEEQISLKKGHAIGTPVVYSPFKKGNNLNHYASAFIIESFIDKINNNYKASQLDYGGRNGILIVDTVVLGHPIFVQEASPVFIAPPLNSLRSGCLWHSCFGKADQLIFDWVESTGRANIGRGLNKNGVLAGEFPLLKNIIFLIHCGNEKKLIGLYRSDLISDNIGETIYELCDFVNDELNSQWYKVPLSPIFDLKPKT
jgi:hypothetical protein